MRPPKPRLTLRRPPLIAAAVVGLALGLLGPTLVNSSHNAWWAQLLYVAGLVICLAATAVLAYDWFLDVSRRSRDRE